MKKLRIGREGASQWRIVAILTDLQLEKTWKPVRCGEEINPRPDGPKRQQEMAELVARSKPGEFEEQNKPEPSGSRQLWGNV